MGPDKFLHGQKTCTVPPCVYMGPAELDEFLNGNVLVWDLKKAGQIFDRHGPIFRTVSYKYPNRATFCSDSGVKPGI